MRVGCMPVVQAGLVWLVLMGCAPRGAQGSDTEPPGPATSPVPAPSAPTAQQLAEERELIRLFADTLEQIRAHYVDARVGDRELIEAAIQGMMQKLDPYSDYIDPTHIDQFQKLMEGEYVGIGVHLGARDGQIQIVSPLYDTPAWRAGLRAGDRILTIGDRATRGLSVEDVVKLMAGAPGTDVTISVWRRAEPEPRTVTLKREVIQQPTVLGYRRSAEGVWDYVCDADHKIGYVRLTSFSRGTASDLASVLTQLQSRGIQGLVLDLRFNPGGILNQAIEVSDLFLREGQIVSVSGRGINPPPWEAHSEGTLIPAGFPMTVLVNRFSASAAEIVSACLQDHHVAVIVGERTWGKGSVQNVIGLEHGRSALKLTTAEYQRPSGQNIHRGPDAKESDPWGVTPDEGYAVAYSDADLLALGNHFNHLDALAEPPPEAAGAEPTPSGDAPDEFVDRQLEKALEYLRGRIHPESTPAPADADATARSGAAAS